MKNDLLGFALCLKDHGRPPVVALHLLEILQDASYGHKDIGVIAEILLGYSREQRDARIKMGQKSTSFQKLE